jgi:ADP-ribose pyrophosphatase
MTAVKRAKSKATTVPAAEVPSTATAEKTAAKKTAVKKAASRKVGTVSKTKAAPETVPVSHTPETASTVAKPQPAPKAKAAQILDSQVAYEGPLFRIVRDHLIEPDGTESRRDVIRHNGSVVILAVDAGKKKKDPWIVIEKQYRHAAGQYLWELPAGKLDAGEKPLDGAKRELAEETGYQAKKWSPLVEYFASPGFLGEAMKVFLAEGLVPGDAHPEEDEHIDFRLVKLSEVLEMIDRGKIADGKTLTSVLLYARQLGIKK